MFSLNILVDKLQKKLAIIVSCLEKQVQNYFKL